MNPGVIRTLIAKDITLYFRDRFFALITVLSLLFYPLIYFVMPGDVDETLEFGLYGENLPALLESHFAAGAAQGVSFEQVESEEALTEAVESGQYVAGVGFTGDIVAAPEDAAITIYFPPNTPAEVGESVSLLFSELGYVLSGQGLNVNITQEIVGEDRVGQQIPLRDRMLPLFAVFVLMVETMGLASLITEEVETRTVRALMVTPMNMGGLFISKGIVGVGLAFGQSALLMAIMGGLSNQPLVILGLLLLGSLLVTGIAFLIASVARDMMSVVSWGVLAVLVLSIPAFTVLFPGGISDWVQVLPSYHLVDAVDQVANFDAPLGDITTNILILLASGVGALLAGGLVLRRKLYVS